MADDQIKSNPFVELGSTGLTRFGGWVDEEWLRDLKGQRGIRIYKEMRDNDPIIGAILFAIKMLIRQASWRVEMAGNTRQDEEVKEFLESCLGDMSHSWHDLVTEILSMLVFGWSYHELVYKRRNGDSRDPTQKSKLTDGRIGWRKIPIRAQETFWEWVFDDKDGSIMALRQQPPPDYRIREIPIGKSLLFRTESNKNNPEGRSLLRNAYKAFYFKKNIEEIEGIGIERDLAGLPVAYVPPELLSPNATSEQRAVLALVRDLVTKIRRDETEGVVFPAEEMSDGSKTGYKLSLLSTGGRRQFDTSSIIERYDRRIAMTVLADFILLGHEKVGSFALASSKTDLFSLAIGAILDSIQEVFNTYAIPRLFGLNSFQGLSKLPVLHHGDVETPDLKELGDYISALGGAGFNVIDDEMENYLRQVASLPQKPKESVGKRLYLPARIKQADGDDRQEFIEVVKELREAVRKAMVEESNPHHDNLGRFATGGAGGGGISAKAERAKASHKPCTKSERAIASQKEEKLAAAVKGKRTDNNKPFDVIKGNHAIEVKTIVRGTNDKITIHPESLARKVNEAKKNGYKTHTVVFDHRVDKVFYKEGLGSFRLKNMQEMTLEQLEGIII